MWLLFGQLLETYGLVFISTTGHTEFGTFKKNYNNLFPKETTFDLVLQSCSRKSLVYLGSWNVVKQLAWLASQIICHRWSSLEGTNSVARDFIDDSHSFFSSGLDMAISCEDLAPIPSNFFNRKRSDLCLFFFFKWAIPGLFFFIFVFSIHSWQ